MMIFVMVIVLMKMTRLIVMVVMMRGRERRIVSLCDVAATAVRKVPAVS